MGGGEIAIIVVIAVIITFCLFLYISNSKKIKQKAKAEKEKKEQEEAKPKQATEESTKEKVKKIVEENSIAVENYIKDTLLKEELESKERNKDIMFEEVSEDEVLKPVDNGDFESGAIVLGQKQSTIHTFEDNYDDENNYGMNTISITNELDSKEDDVISHKHKKFDIEHHASEIVDKTVSSEINDLSNSAKAVIMSGVFDKVDD